MSRLRLALAAAFLFVAGVATWAVLGHERTLASGRVVLAELAPVDPRSLMQGDYMALRFAIDGEIPVHARDATYVHIRLDAENRAKFVAYANTLPADPALIAMKLRDISGRPTIGPNAFFFQEGTAKLFEGAKWGEFRVAADGRALLTHLRDAELQRLGANRR